MLNKQASVASLLYKSLCLTAALTVTKFVASIAMNIATLCFAKKVRIRLSTNWPQRPVCKVKACS